MNTQLNKKSIRYPININQSRLLEIANYLKPAESVPDFCRVAISNELERRMKQNGKTN